MTETWVFSLNEHTPSSFSSRFIFSWIVPCEVIKIITGCTFPPHCIIRKYLGKFPFERYFSQGLVPLSVFQVTNRWDIDKTCKLSHRITRLCQGWERKITEWRKPDLNYYKIKLRHYDTNNCQLLPLMLNQDNPFQLKTFPFYSYLRLFCVQKQELFISSFSFWLLSDVSSAFIFTCYCEQKYGKT